MSTTEIKFLSIVLESRFYSRYVLRLASPCEIRYEVLFYVLKRKRANASDNWSALPLISSLVINIRCSDICYLRCAGRFLVEVNFPHCKANFVFSRRLALGRQPGFVQNRRYLGSSLLRAKISINFSSKNTRCDSLKLSINDRENTIIKCQILVTSLNTVSVVSKCVALSFKKPLSLYS